MKKAKQLDELTREFLMNDHFNSINEYNELIHFVNTKNYECQVEYYIWQITKLSEKIQNIQNIIVENKF